MNLLNMFWLLKREEAPALSSMNYTLRFFCVISTAPETLDLRNKHA